MGLGLGMCDGLSVHLGGLMLCLLLSALLSGKLGPQCVRLHLQKLILLIQLIMKLLIQASREVFLARHRG